MGLLSDHYFMIGLLIISEPYFLPWTKTPFIYSGESVRYFCYLFRSFFVEEEPEEQTYSCSKYSIDLDQNLDLTISYSHALKDEDVLCFSTCYIDYTLSYSALYPAQGSTGSQPVHIAARHAHTHSHHAMFWTCCSGSVRRLWSSEGAAPLAGPSPACQPLLSHHKTQFFICLIRRK